MNEAYQASDREQQILDLVAEYCPGWQGTVTGPNAFNFTQGDANVRTVDIRETRQGDYSSRVLIYMGEDEKPISRERVIMSSDKRIEEYLMDLDISEQSKMAITELLVELAHACHKQAEIGAELEPLTIGEFIDQGPEEKPPLIERIINEGEVVMIYGPSGVGCSVLLLNLLAHASLGIDFNSFVVPQPVNCCYIDFELPLAESKRRLSRITHVYPELRTRLKYLREYRFRISEPGGEATLRRLIRRHNIKLLALDNFPSFIGSIDPNDAGEVTDFVMVRLCNVAASEKCSIIFTHHTGKVITQKSGKFVVPEQPRGSTEIEGKCDMTFRYTWNEPDFSLRKLESRKTRGIDSSSVEAYFSLNKLTMLLHEELMYKEEQEPTPRPISPQEIREIRERLNLTQEQLAERLSVDSRSVKRWEAGENKPGADYRRKLRNLGLDL
jgi:DNA-binding transcriptional regulator YiaG